jgi:hypothetical protein
MLPSSAVASTVSGTATFWVSALFAAVASFTSSRKSRSGSTTIRLLSTVLTPATRRAAAGRGTVSS